MKTRTTILFVGGAALIVAAGLLANSMFHFEPQQITYATGDPVAQAELERLLMKHSVPFTYGSGTPDTKQSGNAVITVTSQGAVVIKDAGAPNAVAAMKEFANWTASLPKTSND